MLTQKIKKQLFYANEDIRGFIGLAVLFLFFYGFSVKDLPAGYDEGYHSMEPFSLGSLLIAIFSVWYAAKKYVTEANKWDNVVELGEINDCTDLVDKEAIVRLIIKSKANYDHDFFVYFELNKIIYKVRTNISIINNYGEVLIQSERVTFAHNYNSISVISLDNYVYKKDGISFATIYDLTQGDKIKKTHFYKSAN